MSGNGTVVQQIIDLQRSPDGKLRADLMALEMEVIGEAQIPDLQGNPKWINIHSIKGNAEHAVMAAMAQITQRTPAAKARVLQELYGAAVKCVKGATAEEVWNLSERTVGVILSMARGNVEFVKAFLEELEKERQGKNPNAEGGDVVPEASTPETQSPTSLQP